MATKPKQEEVIKGTEEETGTLLETARKVLLAAIGAVVLAQEEIEEFINRLIEKGEIAEKDGKKLLNEVLEKRKKGTEKAEDELTKRIESTLNRMSIPSKADIDELSSKIATLSKKIDELKKT